jgi:hypothetical protein
MNLAHERIAELCRQLKLPTMADTLPHIAQQASINDSSFSDFFEARLNRPPDWLGNLLR